MDNQHTAATPKSTLKASPNPNALPPRLLDLAAALAAFIDEADKPIKE